MEEKLFKLTPYVGMSETTKEELREQFEFFLEHPILCGQFMVYCSQGEQMYNRMTAIETMDNIKEYILASRR